MDRKKDFESASEILFFSSVVTLKLSGFYIWLLITPCTLYITSFTPRSTKFLIWTIPYIITPLVEICWMLLRALFWNFLLTICNSPQMFVIPSSSETLKSIYYLIIKLTTFECLNNYSFQTKYCVISQELLV